ncbi:MAG: rod shape-determining protein RodA [Clostridia bacterium]|nr:rod shape-determining protein RodA [Clostridia bacterium]
MFKRLRRSAAYVWENRPNRSTLKLFDWPLFIVILLVSLFGIVCIFSATSYEVTSTPETIMEMVNTQSTYYPGQQGIFLLVALFIMTIVAMIPYPIYSRFATLLYVFVNVLLIATKLLAAAGRGGMNAFLAIGNQGFQPSELCKAIIIICLAATFAKRTDPIRKLGEVLQMAAYIGVPTFLVLIQPDFGTALVYLFVFSIMFFVSKTNLRLIFIIIVGLVLIAIPLLYYMSTTENFRMTRMYMWLDPASYPDEARQIINAQIAIGRGGLTGRGIVSPGSYASLGYISDDHTDFIFAVVCESFGLVGGCSLIAAYVFIVARLIYRITHTESAFGAFIITGVLAMYLMHIIENICMVIGLLPVTGIPLPFVSYGGSNLLTNFIGLGLVENVIMRERLKKVEKKVNTPAYQL